MLYPASLSRTISCLMASFQVHRRRIQVLCVRFFFEGTADLSRTNSNMDACVCVCASQAQNQTWFGSQNQTWFGASQAQNQTVWFVSRDTESPAHTSGKTSWTLSRRSLCALCAIAPARGAGHPITAQRHNRFTASQRGQAQAQPG